MTREEGRALFYSMTETDSLRRHARTVELVMEALAVHYGEDAEKWAFTGLLHDADYEKYPEQHPRIIVQKLKDMGEEEIAYAIAGHYTLWNVPRISLMDKAIVAADELTGFVVACALIRPTKIVGLEVPSVIKKLKTVTFAAKVDRNEVYTGAELLGWKLEDLIAFIISVLERNKEELGMMNIE